MRFTEEELRILILAGAKINVNLAIFPNGYCIAKMLGVTYLYDRDPLKDLANALVKEISILDVDQVKRECNLKD